MVAGLGVPIFRVFTVCKCFTTSILALIDAFSSRF